VRTALTALLVLASAAARAEWLELGESGTATHYLDPASIRKDGPLRRLWELQDLKLRLPNGEYSRRSLFEYDCNAARFRILSVSAFSGQMASGEILVMGVDPGSSGISQSITPGTIAEATLNLVCAP
jgi:hypothetical protein